LNSLTILFCRKLRWTIIPKIDFLNKEGRELDPAHIGLQIALELPAVDPPSRFAIRRKVTIHEKNTASGNVLGELVAMARIEYRIEPKGPPIILLPIEPPGIP
jgi:hypothetical protein